MKLPRINKELDWTLVVVPILLAIAGVATLYSITSVSGKTYLASSQIIYIGVGAVIYFLLMLFDYREFRSFYSYLFIFGVILLFVVDFVGLSIFGSRRWIDLGFFQFQPSELMKLIFLFFAGSFFAKDIKPTLLNVLYFLVLTAIPVLLIMKEPDLGTALTILFGVLIIFFAVKVPMKIIIGGLILIALISPFVWMKLKPYQKSRVTAFIEPNLDTLGSGYNVSQAKIAVGSGGLFGKGFGGATQSQLQFLPVAHIDFIFSGWAEATGFVGSVILTGCRVFYLVSGTGKYRDEYRNYAGNRNPFALGFIWWNFGYN
ncbi:MAG: FtsW/RodA/SpoVE family cell cycle protein [Candidatus Berkelbacteria bacterium]|nr:FtsW/RodA/SpoVE family cell cycle protein [Candidatus Berkelbacteria bacterium]